MQLSEEQKQEIREQKEIIEKQMHRSADFQRVFSGADGQRVLDEIDLVCGLNKNTFHKDPYQNAYNCGARSVALFIHTAIEQDIEKARKMLQDAESQER